MKLLSCDCTINYHNNYLYYNNNESKNIYKNIHGKEKA